VQSGPKNLLWKAYPSYALQIHVLYLEENSGSSSLEVEENVKKSEIREYDTSRWATVDSQQNREFDPGILESSMSSGQRLLSITMRTRGRVLYKWRSLMQEHFLSLAFSI
jgi:hypothetical protein